MYMDGAGAIIITLQQRESVSYLCTFLSIVSSSTQCLQSGNRSPPTQSEGGFLYRLHLFVNMLHSRLILSNLKC